MKLVSDAELIYRLTQDRSAQVECANSAEQKREIAKARTRLHRTVDSFRISERQVLDKIIVWRV